MDTMDIASLSLLTLKELRALGQEHDIPGRSRMKRDELVAALAQVIAAEPPGAIVAAVAGVDIAALVDAVPAENAPAEDAPSALVALPSSPEGMAAEPALAAEAATPDEEAASGAQEVVAEPAVVVPVRPPSLRDLFIDYGPELPPTLPERRVRVMIRDPHSLHVYWTGMGELPIDGWRLDVLSSDGDLISRVQLPPASTSAYVFGSVSRAHRLQLHARLRGGWAAVHTAAVEATHVSSPASEQWRNVGEVPVVGTGFEAGSGGALGDAREPHGIPSSATWAGRV